MSATPVSTVTHSPARPREAQREIEPRNVKFRFSEATPRYWFDGDPFMTHVMNALSLTFPEGERFFMNAVRDLRKYATDPQLERQVRGFLAQEALHRREHEGLNEWLRTQGIDVDSYYADVARLLTVKDPTRGKRARLAVTCALEHFTAIMAEQWLTDDDLRASAHESVRPLWSWHALEELDHKAVAFDVYQAAGGTYAMRVLTMLTVTLGFIGNVSSMHRRMMREDGQRGLRTWARGVWRCWGPRGQFSSLLPAYLRYFKPSFHPWEQDDSALIARFERELSTYDAKAA